MSAVQGGQWEASGAKRRYNRSGHHFATHGDALHEVVGGGHRVVAEAAILWLM